MEGASSFWTPIITLHLSQNLEQFQLSVKFHKDSLLKLGGGENSYMNTNWQGAQVFQKKILLIEVPTIHLGMFVSIL